MTIHLRDHDLIAAEEALVAAPDCMHDARGCCYLCSEDGPPGHPRPFWKEARLRAGYGEVPPNVAPEPLPVLEVPAEVIRGPSEAAIEAYWEEHPNLNWSECRRALRLEQRANSA